MTESNAERLVEDYLRDLDSELRDLPRARRRELVQELSEHIAEARADLPADDEAGLRTLLDHLGDPADIAAEARERLGVRRRKAGAMEVAALVLLPVGGIVIPVLGWVVGVVLLWASDAWTVRDKLIGTLVVPGGLLLPAYLGLVASSAESCSGGIDAGGHVIKQTCSGGSGLPPALAAILMTALVLAPLVSAVYLARRMGPRSATTTVMSGEGAMSAP